MFFVGLACYRLLETGKNVQNLLCLPGRVKFVFYWLRAWHARKIFLAHCVEEGEREWVITDRPYSNSMSVYY